MISEEQKWKDKWDNKVSIDCPKCKVTIRLRQETAEQHEVSIICPACGFPFDYQQPS